MLNLQQLEVTYGQERILRIDSLRASVPGLLFLVGSGGVGKSSLLRLLGPGASRSDGAWRGVATLNGEPVSCTLRVHVPQHARLEAVSSIRLALSQQFQVSLEAMAEQLQALDAPTLAASIAAERAQVTPSLLRLLGVLAGLMGPAALYLADEPTADLDAEHIDLVRRRLGELGRSACVIVATHNRQDCLALGGHTALLAGGVIQEQGATEQFFSNARTVAGQTYVETGACSLPRTQPRDSSGGWWPVPGLLCGMSRPGLMQPAEQQYQRLLAQGVRHLVCLEERCTYPTRPLLDLGIAHYQFSVADMAPPSFNQAVDMCRTLEPFIRENQGVALHCRGGLGRTGTGLAAILIWFGDSATEAIGKIRRAQPLAIQSPSQFRFLHEFADRIRDWQLPATTTKEIMNVPRQSIGPSTN